MISMPEKEESHPAPEKQSGTSTVSEIEMIEESKLSRPIVIEETQLGRILIQVKILAKMAIFVKTQDAKTLTGTSRSSV